MAQKNQKQAEKTAKMNESAHVTTQEVEEKVQQTAKEETVETLESKALKIKKDWNVDKIFYCNGKFYATEAEAIKAGAKGFAYYIF